MTGPAQRSETASSQTLALPIRQNSVDFASASDDERRSFVERGGYFVQDPRLTVRGSAAGLFSERVRHSYGVSLRLSFERTAPFRFDFGFSENNMELSVGYGLTF